VQFLFFEFQKESGHEQKEKSFEDGPFIRQLPRDPASGEWPRDVWLFQNSKRITLSNPASALFPKVRIHLITANRYRYGELYMWENDKPGVRLTRAGEDASGPFWDVDLNEGQRHFFNFKFVRVGSEGSSDKWEWKGANRVWTSSDGTEVWTHSEAPDLAAHAPSERELRLHYRQEGSELPSARLHLWQESSDFSTDVDGVPDLNNPGWTIHRYEVYTGLPYGLRFHNPGAPNGRAWEDSSARRTVTISDMASFWTLEGDSALFSEAPKREQQISVRVTSRTPGGRFDGDPLFAHVWIGRGRAPLQTQVPVDAAGTATFLTYPGITTSLLFHTALHWEQIEHALLSHDAGLGILIHAVLERAPLLRDAPPAALFQDPPFHIGRPGVYERDGKLHFILHAPKASRVRLRGEWMPDSSLGYDLFSTVDGSYWWARIDVNEVNASLGAAGKLADYHGAVTTTFLTTMIADRILLQAGRALRRRRGISAIA
jgi:hypothetical protein